MPRRTCPADATSPRAARALTTAALALLGSLAGCSYEELPAVDPDAAAVDGAPPDGGTPDAAAVDGAPPDGGTLDAAPPDAAPPDAAPTDAAPTDAAPPDAAPPDAAPPDAAPPLAPAAPTGVAASDGAYSDRVEVTWTASAGATGYRVFRSGVELAEVTTTAYDDTTAAKGRPSSVGLAPTASQGTFTDFVTLGWGVPQVLAGVTAAYTVTAFNAAGESAASAADDGFRAGAPVTGYEVKIGSGAYVPVGNTTSFDDETAPAGSLVAGTTVATAGSLTTGVELTLLGALSLPAASQSYTVRAVSADGVGFGSDPVSGFRGVGSLALRWERTSSDADLGYSALTDATTSPFLDATAPSDGAGRYYRAAVSASGAATVRTAGVRGSRGVRPAVATGAADQVTDRALRGRGTLGDLGSPAATAVGLCLGTAPSPAVGGAGVSCQEVGAPALGAFDRAFTGLDPDTTYHLRAYAMHPLLGASYGDDVTAQTAPLAITVAASATPTELALGVGDSASVTVTITNTDPRFASTGAPSVAVTGFPGTSAQTGSTCGATLAAGASCTTTLALTATAVDPGPFSIDVGLAPGGTASVAMTASRPACPAVCGPLGTSDCCATGFVPGNAPGASLPDDMFYRFYDASPDAYNEASYPAEVSDFRLDLYEVTVGRFRTFVDAGFGTLARPPAAGAGGRSYIAGVGWDPAWDASLPATTADLRAALKCNSALQTWTDAPGANEALPINCVSWYVANAFCTWDGGFLPTDVEWNYAAMGGAQHRTYPWSDPPSAMLLDPTYTSYEGLYDGVPGAGFTDLVPAGLQSKGDGYWGHADLAGNVSEWTFDWWSYPGEFQFACTDCVRLTNLYNNRTVRGGSYAANSGYVRSVVRSNSGPLSLDVSIGLRCARLP